MAEELDIQPLPSQEGWAVYAKDSSFKLGYILWDEDEKKFDYKPNANGNMLKITQRESARNQLLAFCDEQTKLKIQSGEKEG